MKINIKNWCSCVTFHATYDLKGLLIARRCRLSQPNKLQFTNRYLAGKTPQTANNLYKQTLDTFLESCVWLLVQNGTIIAIVAKVNYGKIIVNVEWKFILNQRVYRKAVESTWKKIVGAIDSRQPDDKSRKFPDQRPKIRTTYGRRTHSMRFLEEE